MKLNNLSFLPDKYQEGDYLVMGSNNSAVNSKSSMKDYDPEMQDKIVAYMQKKEKRRKIITLSCALVAIACFLYFGVYTYYSERTAADTAGLANLIGNDTFIRVPARQSVMVHRTAEVELPDILDEYITLWNKNKRLIGWIEIPNTNINYPVMQTVNNEYYLDRNFNQEYDRNGSIFMDYQNTLYPRSDNLILYGHHMKSGQMFGHLHRYEKESFYKENPLIRFDTIYEKGTYEVMYAFRSRVYNEEDIVFKYYQFIKVNSAEEFNSNMQEMAALSYYDTGVTAQFGDELLTLSTCDDSQSDGRFVVVAKRVS